MILLKTVPATNPREITGDFGASARRSEQKTIGDRTWEQPRTEETTTLLLRVTSPRKCLSCILSGIYYGILSGIF